MNTQSQFSLHPGNKDRHQEVEAEKDRYNHHGHSKPCRISSRIRNPATTQTWQDGPMGVSNRFSARPLRQRFSDGFCPSKARKGSDLQPHQMPVRFDMEIDLDLANRQIHQTAARRCGTSRKPSMAIEEDPRELENRLRSQKGRRRTGRRSLNSRDSR